MSPDRGLLDPGEPDGSGGSGVGGSSSSRDRYEMDERQGDDRRQQGESSMAGPSSPMTRLFGPQPSLQPHAGPSRSSRSTPPPYDPSAKFDQAAQKLGRGHGPESGSGDFLHTNLCDRTYADRASPSRRWARGTVDGRPMPPDDLSGGYPFPEGLPHEHRHQHHHRSGWEIGDVEHGQKRERSDRLSSGEAGHEAAGADAGAGTRHGVEGHVMPLTGPPGTRDSPPMIAPTPRHATTHQQHHHHHYSGSHQTHSQQPPLSHPREPSDPSSLSLSSSSHPRSAHSSGSNTTTTTPSTTSSPYFETSTRSSISTAFSPTSPRAAGPSMRQWVPTANVPEHLSRRHRKTGGGSRWLSEDEGIGGSGLARRRGSAGAGGSGGGGGGRPSGFGSGAQASAIGSGAGANGSAGLGIGMGASTRRAAPPASPADLPSDLAGATSNHPDLQAGPSRRYKPPPLLKHPSELQVRSSHDRSASSSSNHGAHHHPSQSHSQSPAYGYSESHETGGRRVSSPAIPSQPADLPQIRNLLPRTTVPGLTATGLTPGDPAGVLAIRGGQGGARDGSLSPTTMLGSAASGWRAGDAPHIQDDEIDMMKAQHQQLQGDKEKVWWNAQAEEEAKARPGETERQRSKRELVGKLRRLMTCNLCPPGTHRTFHHPLTLPCGHTLSSDHISVPCPAPLALPPGTAPHEVYAAEQKQHAQRLALWAGVMCPIPTCKRYSPYAVSDIGHEPVSPTVAFRSMSAPLLPARPAPTVMSSGVTYYPSQPPQLAPPSAAVHSTSTGLPPYSIDPPFHEIGSPLLDTAVDKVLGLVLLATGEEGEAYSRTFNADLHKEKAKEKDEGRGKMADTEARTDAQHTMEVDGGNEEASELVRGGASSSSTVPEMPLHARGNTGVSEDLAHVRLDSARSGLQNEHEHEQQPADVASSSAALAAPDSPASSMARSPSFKRPRNRLGTGSASSIDSASSNEPSPANGSNGVGLSGAATAAGDNSADSAETAARTGDPMRGANDVILPSDQMTRVPASTIPGGHPAAVGHPDLAASGGDHPDAGARDASAHPTLSPAHAQGESPSKLVPKQLSPSGKTPIVEEDGTVDSFKTELMSVLECDVCAQLLFDPVTTPCQHSFCTKCIARSLDHSQRCPVCRQNLPQFAFFNEHTINRVLLTVLKTAFPTEYAERQAAIEKDERDARLNTPIFVCTLGFPGMPTILHVFEPRYRLMIRRCIESDTPRFGMVLPSRASRAGQNGGAGGGMFPIMPAAAVPGGGAAGAPAAGTAATNAEAAVAGGELGGIGGVMEYGTMLEIQSVQMLPDGRSMVETVGTHRFRLLEKGSLDGYTVGRVERIDDIPPEEEAALEAEAVRAAKAAKEARAAHSRSLFGHRFGGAASSSGASQPEMAPVPGAVPATMPGVPAGLPTGVPIVPGMSPSLPGQQHQSHTQAHPQAAAQSAQPTINMDDTPQSTAELMNICRSFIDQLRSGSAPWLLQRLNNTYGSMPTDPSEFSYWMALVMPIDEFEKARLLPIRSPRLRLKLIVHWVESLRSSWWFSSG